MSALLPPKKAAAKLGVSVSTLYVYLDKGLLPPRKLVDGRAFWVESDLDAWIAALPQEPARAR